MVHDTTTGRRLGRSYSEGIATVFSGDGRMIATAGDDGIRVRDLPPSK
jgi:hypothetical protein